MTQIQKLAEREKNLIGEIRELREAIETIQQPKTNFEIEHYLVGQHPLPGRQWAQCVLQLQIAMFNIQRAQLAEERLKAEIKKLQESHDPIDCFDAKIKGVDLEELELARLGAIREAETLYTIFKQLKPYTREMLEAEEPEYWKTRLGEQVTLDGNRLAARQMLTPVGEQRPRLLDNEQLSNIALLGEVQKRLTQK